MSLPPTGKLVRDRIPEMIKASGRTPAVVHLEPEQRRPALIAKLSEEVEELVSARPDEVAGELADVLEVLASIAAEHAIDWQQVERTAASKREQRGGFASGVWLIHVDEPR